jgi:hypothetical protein
VCVRAGQASAVDVSRIHASNLSVCCTCRLGLTSGALCWQNSCCATDRPTCSTRLLRRRRRRLTEIKYGINVFVLAGSSEQLGLFCGFCCGVLAVYHCLSVYLSVCLSICLSVCLSQSQKSVTLRPQPGGGTTKSIRDMWWRWKYTYVRTYVKSNEMQQ